MSTPPLSKFNRNANLSKAQEYNTFLAPEADLEVKGQTAFSVVDSFKFFKHIPEGILSSHDIGSLDEHGAWVFDPETWFPLQNFLNAFKQIAEQAGAATLYSIGQNLPKNASFPDWAVDIKSGLKALDVVYHMNHRKKGQVMYDPNSGEMLEGIGHYQYVETDNDSVLEIICDNPYPCRFNEGVISAMATQFQPTVTIRHLPGDCRAKGGSRCVFKISRLSSK